MCLDCSATSMRYEAFLEWRDCALKTVSPVAASAVVVMSTAGVTSDDEVGIIMTLLFQSVYS